MSDADQIIETVAAHHGLAKMLLTNTGRLQHIVLARQTAMYLIRKRLKLSFQQIGLAFNRDHTTALHHTTRITSILNSNWQGEAGEIAELLRQQIAAIERELDAQRSRACEPNSSMQT